MNLIWVAVVRSQENHICKTSLRKRGKREVHERESQTTWWLALLVPFCTAAYRMNTVWKDKTLQLSVSPHPLTALEQCSRSVEHSDTEPRRLVTQHVSFHTKLTQVPAVLWGTAGAFSPSSMATRQMCVPTGVWAWVGWVPPSVTRGKTGSLCDFLSAITAQCATFPTLTHSVSPSLCPSHLAVFSKSLADFLWQGFYHPMQRWRMALQIWNAYFYWNTARRFNLQLLLKASELLRS